MVLQIVQPDQEYCHKCKRIMPMVIKEGRYGGLMVVCSICETLSEKQKIKWKPKEMI